jgi:predicted glycosyltransferase
MRVWVDMTNTAHPVILRPLVEVLENERQAEVVITARPLSHTIELLDDWGHAYTSLGEYGGATRIGKVRAAASRAKQMTTFGRRHGPFDAAIAHGSTDLPVASRILRVPNTTMFDYEWAVAQHNVNCRLANRVLVPDAIPAERLRRFGATKRKLVQYPGLKEEYILHGFVADPHVPKDLGLDLAQPIAVIRTAPSYALYLGGKEAALLPRLIHHLHEQGAQVVVLARNDEQRAEANSTGLDRVIVPTRAVESRSLVAYADVLVSAGGSMNREAAALGTPVFSMFEGKLGGVDERLIEEGRLSMLEQVEDVEVRKRTEAGRPLTTRDPADLLDLALAGL